MKSIFHCILSLALMGLALAVGGGVAAQADTLATIQVSVALEASGPARAASIPTDLVLGYGQGIACPVTVNRPPDTSW